MSAMEVCVTATKESSSEAETQAPSSVCRVFIARCEGEGMARLIEAKVRAHPTACGAEGAAANLTVVGCSAIGASRCSLPGYFLQLYRNGRLHRNEREAIVGREDQLIALQLVHAHLNKQACGEFDVAVSVVTDSLRRLLDLKLSSPLQDNPSMLHAPTDTYSSPADQDLAELCRHYDEFLAECNMRDWVDVCRAVVRDGVRGGAGNGGAAAQNFLCLNVGGDVVERSMLRHLATGRELFEVSVAVSLDESFSQQVEPRSAELLIDPCSMERAIELAGREGAASVRSSVSDVHAEQILLAYLELVVNSRNELALARVVNVPERGLDHAAFTDVKHAARASGLSMYQTLSSFVMRVRLGGRGYAPGPHCPLLPHIKGLSEFTDFMHRLQTIVEEETEPELALKKVCGAVKRALVQRADVPLRRSSVDKAVQGLCESIAEVARAAAVDRDHGTPTRSASDGGSSLGRRTLRLARSVLDRHSSLALARHSAVDVLTDAFTTQTTPVCLPSLLSKFRSPEELAEVAEPLAVRLKQKEIVSERLSMGGNQSCLLWAPAESLRAAPVCVIADYTAPRGTTSTVHPDSTDKSAKRSLCLPSDKENLPNDTPDAIGRRDDESQAVRQITPKNPSLGKRTGTASGLVENMERKRKSLTVRNRNAEESLATNVLKKSNDSAAKLGEKIKALESGANAKKMAKTKATRVKPAPVQIKGQSKLSSFFRA